MSSIHDWHLLSFFHCFKRLPLLSFLFSKKKSRIYKSLIITNSKSGSKLNPNKAVLNQYQGTIKTIALLKLIVSGITSFELYNTIVKKLMAEFL
jgi:hypothetical protein